jgi:hypothetical protein
MALHNFQRLVLRGEALSDGGVLHSDARYVKLWFKVEHDQVVWVLVSDVLVAAIEAV